MSGAEATVVLGIISSIISIVDGTKQVYDAASNAEGLPSAFREVATRIPILPDILDLIEQHIKTEGADGENCKGAKAVVESCETKAKKLMKLFQAVMPADGSSRKERYLSAVKTLGRGSRVETLMKEMLVDVQHLATERGMASETGRQDNQLRKAIQEVAALPPSLSEYAADEPVFAASHSGSGDIYQSQGNQFNNPGSGRIYHANSMTFGSNGMR